MIGNAETIIKYLFQQDREKIFEIKEKRKKRSLSQNAYAWELIGKIADIERLSKEEVYYEMLKHYGQSTIISVLSEVNPNEFFKYYEVIGNGQVNGKDFTHYKFFKGSSEYDSKEMTIFIDGIVQECQQLGIETLTPDQIASMRLV